MQEALENIQRREEESTHSSRPKSIGSTTDPDSRMLPSNEGGFRLNYNAQIGVDARHGMIVAADVTDAIEDSSCLIPMLETTQALTGQRPREVSADGSYNSGPNLAHLEDKNVVGYLPSDGRPPCSGLEWSALPKDKNGRLSKEAFLYDSDRDLYRCPMGQSLVFIGTGREQKNSGERLRRSYRSRMCSNCPRAPECCTNPKQGRTIKRDQYETFREKLRARMITHEAQRRYDLRKQTVEPRFGHIKHGLGIRRFLRRGIEAVQAEWLAICMAVNIQVLLKNVKWLRP